MSSSFGRITIFSGFLFAIGSCVFVIALFGAEEIIMDEPVLTIESFSPVSVTALSYLVFDVETGAEIGAKDAKRQLPIASVTKLATASLFYEDADLEAATTITWQDVNTEGAAGRIHAYEEYTHRELMYPLLLESSNDAATAMLRVSPHLLQKMNDYVEKLGLHNTHFKDPSGLSDGNVSTAHELSILITSLLKKEPHIFDITQLSQYVGTHTGWINNNPLSQLEGFAGGKHGFTYAANRTTVSFFDETFDNGPTRKLGYVLLGSDDLTADIELLRGQVRQSIRYE